MHELYELKEKLCRELKKYSSEDVTTSSLEVVDKLSHAIKNLDKIIEKYEEEEGGNSYGYNGYDSSYRGNTSRGNRNGYSNSYSRGRGRNARRDSMGRYSNDGYSRNSELASELRDLMIDAPDEQTRQEYQKVINKLEMM